MIEIRRLDRSLDYRKYDKVFLIVRSAKSHKYIEQVQELSPQPSLFSLYRRLEKSGKWDKDAFDNIYVPRFIYDLKHSPNAMEKIKELFYADKAGMNICLCCYCSNEVICHRSIIAGILQGLGCNVAITSGNDYSYYYEIYKQTPIY